MHTTARKFIIFTKIRKSWPQKRKKKKKKKSYRDTRRGIYLFNGAESYCLICHKRSQGTKQVDVVI